MPAVPREPPDGLENLALDQRKVVERYCIVHRRASPTVVAVNLQRKSASCRLAPRRARAGGVPSRGVNDFHRTGQRVGAAYALRSAGVTISFNANMRSKANAHRKRAWPSSDTYHG